MASRNIVSVKSVEKIYGYGRNALRVLKGVDLEIEQGEILSIVGPSGAGKSTLMNIMGCLDGFQSGRLVVNERDVSRFSVEDLSDFRNRHIGFIFQLHNLLPEFTALENVMMPLLIRRQSARKARSRALELIETFGLRDRAHHKPAELSGGECQRIAVARSIIGDPDIVLADEPTGSLDSENSGKLIDLLFGLGKEKGTTIVVVTHSREIAEKTGRTVTLVDGEIISDIKNGSTAGEAENHEN